MDGKRNRKENNGRMKEPIERHCKNCDKIFQTRNKAQEYCSEICRLEKNQQAKKRKKKENPLVKLAVEAKEAGMSYGKYVEMIEREERMKKA